MNILRNFIIIIKSCISFFKTILYHFFLGLITIIIIIPKYLILGIQCIFSEKKQKELKMEDKIIPIIIVTLSITTYLISIFIISRWYVQNERNKKFTKSLNELTEIVAKKEETIPEQNQETSTPTTNQNTNQLSDLNFLNVNLTPYINKNSETVAWLKVNGTNINYPVVQHKDNNYYLEHDFYKRKTNIGWVFADYRDNFEDFNNNTIIYAHNLVNRTMFGQIPYLLKSSWQSNPNNYYIKLSTKTTNSIWQIFSVYKSNPTTNYLQSKFNSKETYKKFINDLKNKSSFDFKTTVSENDKIITLSTCDDTGTKRIAVHAKLIKIENK